MDALYRLDVHLAIITGDLVTEKWGRLDLDTRFKDIRNNLYQGFNIGLGREYPVRDASMAR